MEKFEKLNDYIYVLYGTDSSNIYYLDCSKKAIVDTGNPREIEENIEAFKRNSIDITKIDYIINT
jgi:glyoxylase-like metal-dependent hydrolase (beta-lactamase superfamily II)